MGGKCKHCNYLVTGDADKMNRHLVKCEADRPFQCDALVINGEDDAGEVCGRRFPTERSLKGHQSKFHTGEELGAKYRCDIDGCQFGSDSTASMEHHHRMHERGYRRRSRSREPSVARTFGGGRQSASRSRSRSNVRFPAPMNNDGAAGQQHEAAAGQEDMEQQMEELARAEQNASAAIEQAFTTIRDGMYNLRLIDPDQARRIMRSQHQALDEIVARISRDFNQVSEMCRRNNIELKAYGVERAIQDYHAFGSSDVVLNFDDEEEEDDTGHMHESTSSVE